MRYSFRLAQLLKHTPDPRKRPGTIKIIAEHTGLDRHQVAALLKNEVKYIPLHALSRLCDYLIEHNYASADQLPGALFAVEPESFWELLARRKRLELCMGVRRDEQQQWPEAAWIVASDSLLLGEVLNGVSTLGGTAKFQPNDEARPDRRPPHPESLRQSLVWSPGQQDQEEVENSAQRVLDDFRQSADDRALVCLGSIKSNPVVELVLANAFNTDPFVTQDNVSAAADRSCPFLLRYRQHDPHPESCSGGLRLSSTEPADRPGLYYEQKDGRWKCIPWDGKGQDTAFVFYVHRESLGSMEMVLGGFSGRATRLLAKLLSTRAADFWPPVYQGPGIQIGAFVVRFKAGSGESHPADILQTDFSGQADVIPLNEAVIERRMQASGA